MIQVDCRSCFRKEHWSDDAREVVQAGGSRQPAEHPILAAWHTLVTARRGGRVVVGSCVCGQPLIAMSGPPIPWTLDTSTGAFTVSTDAIEGPAGAVTIAEVEATLTKLYGPRFEFRPASALFQGTLMLSIVAPMLLWVGALVTVILILSALARPAGL